MRTIVSIIIILVALLVLYAIATGLYVDVLHPYTPPPR